MRVLVALWLLAAPVVFAGDDGLVDLGEALAIGRRGKASTIRRGVNSGGALSTAGFFTVFQGNFEEEADEATLGEASGPGSAAGAYGSATYGRATYGSATSAAAAAATTEVSLLKLHSYNSTQADEHPKDTAIGRTRDKFRNWKCAKAICNCGTSRRRVSSNGNLPAFNKHLATGACEPEDQVDGDALEVKKRGLGPFCSDLSMDGGAIFGAGPFEAKPNHACTQCPKGRAFAMKMGKDRTGQCENYNLKPFLSCINLGINEYDGVRKPASGRPRLCTKVARTESPFRVSDFHDTTIQQNAKGLWGFASVVCNARKETVCEGARCSVKKTVKCAGVCKSKLSADKQTLVADRANCIQCPASDSLCLDVMLAL